MPRKMASKPSVSRIFQGEILAEFDVRCDLDAQIENAVDFPLQDLLGQTVFGDAVADHAAQLGHHIEDGDLRGPGAAGNRRAQPRRTAADNGDFFAGVGSTGIGSRLPEFIS